MRTLFTFLATLFFVTALQAKIVYLNNNLEEPNISENLFINWSDAYAAVSAGDTIYVVGSNFDHGNITISKPVTVIGPGYFLNENDQTQINKKEALFSQIVLDESAGGAKLIGLSLSRNVTGISIKGDIDNVSIENCYTSEINLDVRTGSVYDNVEIKGCYIYYSGLYMSGRNVSDGVATNLTLINNIIDGGIGMADGSTGLISNNLFLGNMLELGTSSSFEFLNNIYINEDTDKFTIQPLPDASIHHNISLTGAFGNANDNFTAPESTLFNTDENASTDAQYMLSENSPAKGAGSNGSDIGPFGGPDPYHLSGLPNLPNIYELSTGGFVVGDELSVQIKIKQ